MSTTVGRWVVKKGQKYVHVVIECPLELFEGMISRNFPVNCITQRPCTYNLLDYSTVILKLYMHFYYISLVKDKTYLHMYLIQLLCFLFELKQLADHSVLR